MRYYPMISENLLKGLPRRTYLPTKPTQFLLYMIWIFIGFNLVYWNSLTDSLFLVGPNLERKCFFFKQPFFRVGMSGLGKYHIGRYGRIGVYRIKPKFHQKLRSHWLLNTRKGHKQYQIYLTNEKPNMRLANAIIFQHSHVDIGNAKLLRWGSKPTPSPNANRFAFWWNIGFRAMFQHPCVCLSGLKTGPTG